MIALGASGLGLCPRLGGSPLPSGHPPVLPYRWASQASWPAEPAAFVAALKQLDMDAVREDLKLMFKTSQVWWPADYGNVCHTGLEPSTSRPHAALCVPHAAPLLLTRASLALDSTDRSSCGWRGTTRAPTAPPTAGAASTAAANASSLSAR